MRLTVMLDEKLIYEAVRLSGTKTINEVISIALQEFVTTRKQFLKMGYTPPETLFAMHAGNIQSEDNLVAPLDIDWDAE